VRRRERLRYDVCVCVRERDRQREREQILVREHLGKPQGDDHCTHVRRDLIQRQKRPRIEISLRQLDPEASELSVRDLGKRQKET